MICKQIIVNELEIYQFLSLKPLQRLEDSNNSVGSGYPDLFIIESVKLVIDTNVVVNKIDNDIRINDKFDTKEKNL